jgi:hypothetical protein
LKYIQSLKIDINHYISKNFFTKNITTDHLIIRGTWIERNALTYFFTIYSDLAIVNSLNFNEIKKFLDTSDPDEYPNIKNYSFYYDYIATQFIDFIKRNNHLKINLNDYVLKSSEESYKYFLHNKKDLSERKKEELKSVIFRNINYKCKYAANILVDRLPQYEKELLKLDINSDDVNMYLNNVLIYLINANHYVNDKILDFEKFYRESELYRKIVNYRMDNNLFASLKISYRNDTLDDLALKYLDSLQSYIESVYLNSGEPIKSIHQELSNFIKKINKIPKAIHIYYGGFFNTGKRKIIYLPENKEIRETLMTDPDSFTRFIINDIYSLPFEQIEESFPGYQKVVSKIDSLHLMKDFFGSISYKFFKGIYSPNFKNHNEIYKKLKEYIYDNYPELIEKTSKNALYSYYFAHAIGAPFKEGESVILKEKTTRRSYLKFLKNDLGPDLVPDYDRYDFSELDEEYKEEED